MHTVLVVVGWILLGVLLLLVLLLLWPIKLLLAYDIQGFRAKLQILFFRYPIYPRPEKAEETEGETPLQADAEIETEKATEAAEKKAKKVIKKGVRFSNIAQVLSTAGKAMQIVFRAVRMTDIEIVYPVYREDAAECALAYGKTQAYLGTAFAVLENAVHLHYKSVHILPDFQNEFAEKQSFSCKICATPIIMLIAALYLFKRLKEEKVL